MKRSPLCSRDNGREVHFTFRENEREAKVILSTEMLDDTLGDVATESQRLEWVEDNIENILNAARNGVAQSPFDRVLVKELS